MSTQADFTIAERIRCIDALDLEPIKVKLTHSGDGPGWTLEHADAAEQDYKRFLVLNLKYPRRSIVPSHTSDTFWHYHILDTMKYAEDCDIVFGRFLHHFPYFGLLGPEDEIALATAWEDTSELYLAEFGVTMIGTAGSCEGDVCSPTPSCNSESPTTLPRPRPVRESA
jgi:hypothetical protein